MMNRYGDTPRGMVESCMEFLQICREQNFDNVVISMKTSNTVMMVYAVRLLVAEMERNAIYFPLHLGVTEAGDGEDGRIKSAVGIGALLADGIGDTIRVSLSEPPENEIPVARLLADYALQRADYKHITTKTNPDFSPFEYNRRKTVSVSNIGGENAPVVISKTKGNFEILPDYIFDIDTSTIRHSTLDAESPVNKKLRVVSRLHRDKLRNDVLNSNDCVLLFTPESQDFIGETRAFFHTLLNENCNIPVIIHKKYTENDLQALQIKAAIDFGSLLIDGFGDGIFIENEGEIAQANVVSLMFGILQAVRVRTVRTEYISCPSCGRTLFDLQSVIARIKARTSHLRGLKIGIMGCIVNGPGEMADADYGYVGAGRGKVSLYRKKECVERNIPENEAVERLVALIQANGDWTD
jgi:(E)-4-hydroxy-3-methylbut-2-enyl-diphosphate synthase